MHPYSKDTTRKMPTTAGTGRMVQSGEVGNYQPNHFSIMELNVATIGSWRTHERSRKLVKIVEWCDRTILAITIIAVVAAIWFSGFASGMAYGDKLNAWADMVVAQ
jgi:hypothetical protein